jgi:hypothetical protein
MSYTGKPSTRWDRFAGLVVWFVVGFALLLPMSALLVEGCFWEEGCGSSQAPRFLGSFLAAFVFAAPFGWVACAGLKRLLNRLRS